MRSTLKKSLYLGLAALSFASVAGAANNADAAKKTKPAKTYATASYQNIPDQGQSNVAYNVTGSNALFNKPGTVKGAKQVASKATMSDLASSKQNFMVYQTATTNRGSKYIKVVSFDKQYRGWIYAGNNTSASYGTGVQQVNLTSSASSQYSSVYLKNPGQVSLKNSPEGAQFNASQNTFGHTGFVAKDAFTVDAAQTVTRTGTTWYHLTNKNDSTINGWVPSDQVQLSSSNNYFDKSNQVQVNFTNNGSIVKTAYVPINSSATRQNYANGVLDPSTLATSINQNVVSTSDGSYANTNAGNAGLYGTASPLYGSGWKLDSALNGNTSNLQYVKPGDTINTPVVSSSQYGSVASNVTFNVTNGVSASTLNTSNTYMPSLTDSQQSQLRGNNTNQYLSDSVWNSTSGSLFAAPTNASNYGAGLGKLYGKDQTATTSLNNGAIAQGSTFHYEYTLNLDATKAANSGKTYGQNINLYYTATAVAGSANVSGNAASTNTNYLG